MTVAELIEKLQAIDGKCNVEVETNAAYTSCTKVAVWDATAHLGFIRITGSDNFLGEFIENDCGV